MRVMGDGQTNNQRLEQFTLASSSGASDHAMGAMSRFVQVDPDGSIDPLPSKHRRHASTGPGVPDLEQYDPDPDAPTAAKLERPT